MSNLRESFNEKYVILIMTLVTVVPPYTTLLSGFGGHGHQISNVSISIHALLWAIFPPEFSYGGLQILNLIALSFGIPLGFLNIIFAFQVVRYFRGETSKRRTLLAGISTLIVPFTSLIIVLPIMISSGLYVYIGPIPVQLITGLLLMYFAGPKEPTSPW